MKQKMNPAFDPWESYLDVIHNGKMKLTNIELTTTTLCNMRCEHCAVGYTLSSKDPEGLSLDLIIRRLEEVSNLRCLSITGGEPMLSTKSIKNYVLPLLKYAHERGVFTQINSNLTLELERYETIAPFLDVLHVSHNWGTIDDFVEAGFAHMQNKPSLQQREHYFNRIIENSKALSKGGVFVSAETMLNKRTFPHLETIHKQITNEMLCQRHEIHPMYPSDFASSLETLSLHEIQEAVRRLLEARDPDIWMLFGTLPFYACSDREQDLSLLQQLYNTKNVTIRNDPDGRSRLNMNIFNGDVIVTDFGDIPPLGNILEDSLPDIFDTWMKSNHAVKLNCHCPNVRCLGPNFLVKNTYYPHVNFNERESHIVRPAFR